MPFADRLRRVCRRVWSATIALVVVLALACSRATDAPGRSERPAAAADPGVVHVHGLGVDPADGALFAATHSGLFRINNDGTARRVADNYQDTMGFTVVGPGHFLGSGHPDLRDYQAKRLPPLLGLVESRDAGRTWQPRSLLGQADFHVLRAAHGRVYAYDSSSGAFMVGDGSAWETRSKLPMVDFAVSPVDPEMIIATVPQGVRRSADGGRSWEPVDAPALVLIAWNGDSLWGIAADGSVHRGSAAADWRRRGALDGRPEALLVTSGRLYAAVHEGGIVASDDGGLTWRVVYKARS